MLVLYILLGIFFISTGVFIFLYLRNSSRLKLVIDDVLNLKVRTGYYQDSVDLLREPHLDKNDKKNFDRYDVVIYVTEIDRYTNGESKIELNKVEVVSGFSPSQYKYIRETISERFCTLKDTSKIVWLESQNAIKEIRKEKLNKIMKK